MFNELRGRVAEFRENFNSKKRDMKPIKKNQSEMKSTLTENNL